MDIFEVYGKAIDDIQTIHRSRLLTQVLLSLRGNKKTLTQIREVTGSTSQAIIPRIRILESQQLIESTDHEYYLTPLGKIVTSKIADYIMTMGGIRQHRYFWANHYLEGIPTQLLNDIGCLYNSRIIADTNVEIFNVYKNYLKILNEAEHIYGVAPIMSTGHADAIAERVGKGIPVELIVSSDVSEQLKQEPYEDKIEALKEYTNFRLLVTDENLRFGLTVTDKCLSLGLYKRDGVTYDTTTDLFSYDQMAVKWGERLFGYYKDMTRPF